MQWWRTLGALVAAASWAIPGLGALSHAHENAHAVCPEHGELIHVEATEREPGAEAGLWANENAASPHEHCDPSFSLRSESAALQPDTGAFIAARSTPVAAPSAAPPRPAPLAYAPKSSPPA